ncbi:MAG TPA: energy transducer TonB [Terriglobia bacterium]|nr:energy transducer TonB [Terriglobia bacterium]
MASDMFSTLDPSPGGRRRRGAAFICGLFVQALLMGGAALLAVIFPQELPVSARQYVVTWLPPLPTPAPPAVKPPRAVARVVVPKLKSPVVPKLLAPAMAVLEAPKIRPTVAPVTISALRVPMPPPPAFAQPTPAPPPPKVQVEVRTGDFGGAAEPVTTKRPAEQVQTGGFGSPQGLPGHAQGNSPGNVPKLGSFGLPDGPGVGNGTGGAHGIQGVVASAGFGSGIAGPGYGAGGGGTRVTVGGFEKVAQVSQNPTKSQQAPQPVDFLPVEISSKPTPVYTEEARRLGIQGEVTLSVIFEASGTIKVLGVVKSLGHGLDQAAQQAAALIRFKPALRDGKPADFPATLRIEFRLADQST